jgi:hypothetical protein
MKVDSLPSSHGQYGISWRSLGSSLSEHRRRGHFPQPRVCTRYAVKPGLALSGIEAPATPHSEQPNTLYRVVMDMPLNYLVYLGPCDCSRQTILDTQGLLSKCGLTTVTKVYSPFNSRKKDEVRDRGCLRSAAGA